VHNELVQSGSLESITKASVFQGPRQHDCCLVRKIN
jgi:hypothetical protein